MTDFIKIVKQIGTEYDTKEKLRGIYKACPYSVSKIIETLKPPFDKEAIAKKTFLKNFDNPDSKYYQMSISDIIAEWEAKGKRGQENGKILDMYIGFTLEPSSNSEELKSKILETAYPEAKKKCHQFDLFCKQNVEGKLNYLIRERMLVDKKHGVNGRFDAMFSVGDKLLLVDWKNTQEIKTSNKYEKLKGPLYEYDNCDLNTYTVQLYIYVYILRNVYGLTEIPIIPLIVRIGEDDYGIFTPVIPYSDKLVENIIEYAVAEINTLKK